jgi:hypothetical protein
MKDILAKIPDTIEIPAHLECTGAQGSLCMPHDRRRFARRRMGGTILCQITSPLPAVTRSAAPSKVLTVDISRSGISFLADKQFYPEEEVLLWTLIGRIPCRVARCLKHNDRCYEVGAEICK